MKVTVVGAGNVGATCAQRIAEADLADVYLVDVVEGLARGKALDLAQAAPIVGHSRSIEGGEDWAGAAGSDIIVLTAGKPRTPGMSRDDLLQVNAAITSSVVERLMPVAPEALLLMVANPLDVTTYVAAQVSGLPRERVIGMAGVLDTARFRAFIAMEIGCCPSEVTAMVLGGHGDSMVPLPRHSTVSGIPITQLISEERLAAIVERTRQGGGEIVSYLKTGSAFYAPAAAVTQMVGAILRDEKRILPTCVRLQGEYGMDDVFLGVPAMLGAAGMEQVVEVDLDDEERSALELSAQHVRDTVDQWRNLQQDA
jgi:malate dehydrogenase